MPSVCSNYTLIFCLIFIAFTLPFRNAVPVARTDNPYDEFIEFLLKSNCSMPNEVELPFQRTDSNPFSYLSTPLKECQTPDAEQDKEAILLCKEIFGVLQNITCNENNSLLSKINSSHLSENVCGDFEVIQDVLPNQSEYLSGKLGDGVICELLCTKKYDLLCKTLLWSYDTQAKIKTALESKVEENVQEKENYIASNKDASNIEDNVAETEIDLESQGISKLPNKKVTPGAHLANQNISLNGSNINNFKLTSTNMERSNLGQTNVSTINQDGESIDATGISTKIKKPILSEVVTQSYTDIMPQKYIHKENIQPSKFDLNLPDKNVGHEENNVINQSKNLKLDNHLTNSNPDNTIINTLTYENKDNQNGESNTSVYIMPHEENVDSTNSNKNSKTKVKPKNPIIMTSEIDNDLNNINLQKQENETTAKGKQKDLNKSAEKTKNAFEVLNEATSDTNSKLELTTSFQTISDKSEDLEQHEEDKDQDDTKIDEDYPGTDFDSQFSLLQKNKDSDDKSTGVAASSKMPSKYNLGSASNDIQVISSFPEQEDSHFFFYFLSIVLILMAGYLIFHNKQKIIALIVEGRHERRRRSHGAGYKKLETK